MATRREIESVLIEADDDMRIVLGVVMLTSVPANVRAHSLYTRMGFEYYGVYPDSEFLYIKRYSA